MAEQAKKPGSGPVTDADIAEDTELALLDPICAQSDEIKGLITQRRKLYDSMRSLLKQEDFGPEQQTKFDQMQADEDRLKKRQDNLGRILVTEARRREQMEADREFEDEQRKRLGDLLPNYRQSAAQPDTIVDESRCFKAWALGDSARPEDVEYARNHKFPLNSRITLLFHRGLDEDGVIIPSSVPQHTLPGIPPINRRTAIRHLASRVESYRHLVGGSSADDNQVDAHYRQQGTTPDTAGGYTVPNEMMRTIDIALKDFTGPRASSEIMSTMTGARLPAPTVNDTAQMGERVAEQGAVGSQDIVFGNVDFDATKYSSKEVLISLELLQDSATNMPALIGRLLGERIGRIHSDDFTVGTGTGQPQGIVTGSALGHTAAATAVFTWQELMTLEHSVDPAYRQSPGAGWMLHDSALLVMKQIADSQGRPLWQTSLVTGAPGTFDGFPIFVNQSMPVPAASAKSVLFGALRKFVIRDVLPMTLFRLDELHIKNGQIGYLMFSRNDSRLMDAGTGPIKHLAQSAT